MTQTIDATNLTPKAACLVFNTEVQRVMAEPGHDFTQAWKIVEATQPALYQRMLEVSIAPKVEPLANIINRNIVPPTPENIEALGLPRDASIEEFQTALRANGNATTPRKSDLIFEALKKMNWQALGGTEADARKRTARRFPVLGRALGLRALLEGA
jgi:hypothetical protein